MSPSTRRPRAPGPRIVRFAVVISATLAAMGCHPGHRTLELTPTPGGLVTRVPPYITSGDSLEVVVHDRDWSHEYVVTASGVTRTETSRAPVFGSATGLGAITRGFPLTFHPTSAAAQVAFVGATGIAEVGEPSWPAAARDVDSLLGAPGGTSGARVAALRQALRRLDAYLDSMAPVVDQRTGVVNALLGTLHQRLAKSPGEVRLLRFLADTLLHATLVDFSRDPAAASLQQQLADAMRRDTASLDTAAATAAVLAQDAYLRKLRAISALVPPFPEPIDGDVGTLGEALGSLKLAVALHDSADARFRAGEALSRKVVEQLRAGSPAASDGFHASPTEAMEPLEAAGTALCPLLKADRPGGDLEVLRGAVFTIDANTRTVVATVAQLPAWVRGPGSETVYGHVFHGSETLTIDVRRRPRFMIFNFAPDTGAEAEPSGAARSAVQTADTPIVGSYKVLLAERFRFHVGAGFVYSRLHTRTFESTSATEGGVSGIRVRETGEARNAVFPALVVSYALLPTAGRVLDGQVDRNRFTVARAGLSVQTGMSLQAPTEQLYFGLSTEPFPGLSLGAGYSLAYLERSSRTGFVPDAEGNPVRKRWLGDWGAFSLVVDAAVFTSTIGALLH
jgi:hypothetical protein